jgi:hypothetical protein
MAGPVFVRKRLWNIPKTHIFGDTSNILDLQRTTHDDPKQIPTFTIFWEGATQAGAEELGTAATAAKDGTTTPFQIIVVSAAVTDIDNAGGHVRKIAAIGLTTNSLAGYAAYLANPLTPAGKAGKPILSVEVLNMNGTTDVTSTRFYIREPIHGYAIHWGSGGQDASAAITIEAPANTALLTIAINQNESNSCTLWFPKDTLVLIDQGNFNVNDATLTGQGDGMMTSITESGFADGIDPDIPATNITVNAYRPFTHIESIWTIPKKTTSLDGVANLVFAEVLVGNSETCTIDLMVHMDLPPEYYNR